MWFPSNLSFMVICFVVNKNNQMTAIFNPGFQNTYTNKHWKCDTNLKKVKPANNSNVIVIYKVWNHFNELQN